MFFVPDGQVGVGEERPPEGHRVVARAQVAFPEVLLLVVAVVGHDDAAEHFADGPAVGCSFRVAASIDCFEVRDTLLAAANSVVPALWKNKTPYFFIYQSVWCAVNLKDAFRRPCGRFSFRLAASIGLFAIAINFFQTATSDKQPPGMYCRYFFVASARRIVLLETQL